MFILKNYFSSIFSQYVSFLLLLILSYLFFPFYLSLLQLLSLNLLWCSIKRRFRVFVYDYDNWQFRGVISFPSDGIRSTQTDVIICSRQLDIDIIVIVRWSDKIVTSAVNAPTMTFHANVIVLVWLQLASSRELTAARIHILRWENSSRINARLSYRSYVQFLTLDTEWRSVKW